MGLCILFWAFVSFPTSPLLVQRRPCHRGKGTRRSLGTWQLLSCSLSNFDFSLFNWEASQCLPTQALCAPRPSSRSVHCAGFSSDWNIQLGGGGANSLNLQRFSRASATTQRAKAQAHKDPAILY